MAHEVNGPLVGMVGLTHLGLVTGISFASRGFSVLGFDPDQKLVSDLRADKLPIFEPQLEELFAASKAKIRFSSSVADILACDVVYVALDVKTDQNNVSDLGPLRSLIAEAGEYLKPGSTLVIHSQVPPGFCRELSNRLSGRGIRVYYQVEVLIFGRAVERALQPERYIVGCADSEIPIPEAYLALLSPFGCPILKMRYESAELGKIAINMFLISSVCMSNLLAEVCEKIGADWNEIAPALRLDKRIGAHAYLSPGLGISGGNLERDLATVGRLGHEHGADVVLAEALVHDSLYRRDWVLRTLSAELLSRFPDPLIALWGLAYKANTKSVKNSPSIQLLSDIPNLRVQAYDPEVDAPPMGPRMRQVGTARESSRGADALVVMTPWDEFSSVPIREIMGEMKGKLIIDPFGVLLKQKVKFSPGTKYFRLGGS